MDIVECHSGFTYAEKPVSLTWEGKRLEVDEILAAWTTPTGRLFRVRTRDLQLFQLVYCYMDDSWQIHPL